MATITFKGLKLTGEGKKYIAELQKLRDQEIHVGFQAGEDPYDDGADLVDIAAFNEYGTSDIPARPFMKQAWEDHKDDLQKVCQEGLNRIASGGSAESALKLIGVAGVGYVQQEIVEGSFVPNAPSTIRKKKSDRPLIDTGHMRQSVKYVVKKG